jgi:high-affinity nickel-transport protein
MLSSFRRIFNEGTSDLRGKVVGMYVFLGAANIAAWVWAITAFHHHPVLLGTALLAYSFGLRHAVDADHIAAIDNVTRKLMQQNRRPIAVGFYDDLEVFHEKRSADIRP